MDVSSDPQKGCIVRVPVQVRDAFGSLVKESQATSIRVWVQATRQVAPSNATAFMTRVERKTADGAWEESGHHEIVPLVWADTNNRQTDLSDLFPKFVAVLHIDRDDAVLNMWNAPMPLSLVEFLKPFTTYRFTVSVLAEGITKQTAFEIDWKGQWDAIEMRPI